MPTQSVPAICYDLPAVSRFCRSVALAMAFQKHTQLEWVENRDSGVLNALYSVMFWKTPPGSADLRQSSQAEIEATTDQMHEHFLLTWLNKLSDKGPAVAGAYISELLKIREHARDAVQDVFRDVYSVNQMVAGELKDAITNLARIKLAGTVGVAVLGAAGAIVLAPAGAIICGGLSFGYSSTCSLIKTWEQGSGAKAVGISVEGGKAVGGEVLGRAAEAGNVRALASQAKAEQIIKSCEGQIRKFSQRLTQDGLRKAQLAKARGIVRSSASQAAVQQQVLGQASRAARVASVAKVGVPLVFAAWDIWEGFSDYGETMDQLK